MDLKGLDDTAIIKAKEINRIGDQIDDRLGDLQTRI